MTSGRRDSRGSSYSRIAKQVLAASSASTNSWHSRCSQGIEVTQARICSLVALGMKFSSRRRTTHRNGLALCKLHHAAFDRHFLGVRPDLTVELRPDVLREPDGPMLRYGLLPRDPALRPNREFMEERYGMFRKAG